MKCLKNNRVVQKELKNMKCYQNKPKNTNKNDCRFTSGDLVEKFIKDEIGSDYLNQKSKRKDVKNCNHHWQNKPHLIYCKQPDYIYYEDRCKLCGETYSTDPLLRAKKIYNNR